MGSPEDAGEGRGKGKEASSKQLLRELFPERSPCWETLWTEAKEIARLEFK